MRHPWAWRLVTYVCTVVLLYAILSAPRSVQIAWFLFQGSLGILLAFLVYRDKEEEEA